MDNNRARFIAILTAAQRNTARLFSAAKDDL
jgi:hypothetical protein